MANIVVYAVILKGGSIGERNSHDEFYRGDPIVDRFLTKEEASDYAKRARSHLSKGERRYYKMGYRVVKIKAS
jgi:hypothetical protein